MKLLKLALSFFIIMNSLKCFHANKYTEKTLREDMVKLMEGNLEFTDRIPFYEEELPDTTAANHSEYDFIVIGAGSAGAVIASRLSEIKNVTVLLIEAGSKEYPIMDVPMSVAALQMSDEINWKYYTEKSEKYCLGMTDRRCYLPRGKVMGGSSVLNYMIATRGNRRDYDHWAELSGDDSWSYRKMLRYLKKLENFQAGGEQTDEMLRGKNGPVYISKIEPSTDIGNSFMEAGRKLGFPEVDYNGAEQAGFCYLQTTTRNGERWSTNRAYLHPLRNRQNLSLTRNSRVVKILINKDTGKAYGVQYVKSDENFVAKARKEIILSAGAIGSPQILLLSGIGPQKHLRDLGIEVIKHAAVGQNLMDHIFYGGLIFKVNDSSTFVDSNPLDPKNPAIHNYTKNRKGPLTEIGFDVIAYVDVDGKERNSGNASIELIFGVGSGMKDPLMSNDFGISQKYRDQMNADKFNHRAWTVFPMLMKPRSRGQLTLRSADPKDKPVIQPNYLKDPEDIRVLTKGIRFVLELSKTEDLRKYGSELYEIPMPCADHEFDSDAYWECAIRTFMLTIYHQSGTCKMGKENDETAVVNSKLQVIGVKGLRVADASIMPVITSAHPNVPIIAMSEKISDVIKKHWNYI